MNSDSLACARRRARTDAFGRRELDPMQRDRHVLDRPAEFD